MVVCVNYTFFTILICPKLEMLQSNMEWKYLKTYTSQQKTGYKL
jgi:hypothetical protein